MDVVSDPSVSSSAPVIDPSSSFVSGRSKMSFTEKPVFVLVNDIFWKGGGREICREKLQQPASRTIRCFETKTKRKKKKKRKKEKRSRGDGSGKIGCVRVALR